MIVASFQLLQPPDNPSVYKTNFMWRVEKSFLLLIKLKRFSLAIHTKNTCRQIPTRWSCIVIERRLKIWLPKQTGNTPFLPKEHRGEIRACKMTADESVQSINSLKVGWSDNACKEETITTAEYVLYIFKSDSYPRINARPHDPDCTLTIDVQITFSSYSSL